MYFIGFLSIISLCGSVSIPIQRTLGNRPSVTVGVDESTAFRFDLVISSVSRSRDWSDDEDVVVHLPGNNLIVPMYNTRATTSTLGIGPGSPFLDRFGSAGIFRDELVFNMTQSDFVSRCEPGTNFTIPPLNRFQDTYYIGAASMWLGGIPQGLPVITPSALVLAETSRRLVVPVEVYDRLGLYLLEMGAVRFPNNNDYYQNCTCDAINSLPEILIGFGTYGHILVNVSSFIRLDPEEERCLVQIESGPSPPFNWAFNPLILPQVAVYVTNEGDMTFCDELDL